MTIHQSVISVFKPIIIQSEHEIFGIDGKQDIADYREAWGGTPAPSDWDQADFISYGLHMLSHMDQNPANRYHWYHNPNGVRAN